MSNAIAKTEKSTLAKYSGFDIEEMQEVAEQLPTGSSNYFKPRQGKNAVRFMPAPAGTPAHVRWHKHHFEMGGERKQIVCAKYQTSEPCAICAQGQKLRATGNPRDARQARAYEPKVQIYVNMVDMTNPEKGPQIWSMTGKQWKEIVQAVDMADLKNPKMFADPLVGYNIKFFRKGEGLKTEYSNWSLASEPSPIPDFEDIKDRVVDLRNVEQLPSDEDVDEALEGDWKAPPVRGGGKGRNKGGKAREKEEPEDAETESDDIEY